MKSSYIILPPLNSWRAACQIHHRVRVQKEHYINGPRFTWRDYQFIKTTFENHFCGWTMNFKYSQNKFKFWKKTKNGQFFYLNWKLQICPHKDIPLKKTICVNIFSSFDFNSCTNLESSIMSCDFPNIIAC